MMLCAKILKVLFVRWGEIVLIAGESEYREVRIDLLYLWLLGEGGD